MNTSHSNIRRFTLADGMIVVGALAATFALVRITFPAVAALRQSYFELTRLPLINPRLLIMRLTNVHIRSIRLGVLLQLHVFIWFCAFATMRILRPRPPLQAALVQPGMIAFWAAGSTLLIGLLAALIGGVATEWEAILLVKCLAVPIAWGTLKMVNCWRAEASWVDRFGRTLGLLWWAETWVNTAFLLYLSFAWSSSAFSSL